MSKLRSMLVITPTTCRGARALLDWSQGDLAKASNLSLTTIRDYEAGRREPGPNNLAAMQWALEHAGVQFSETETHIGALVKKGQ